jgi:hypothetical protein
MGNTCFHVIDRTINLIVRSIENVTDKCNSLIMIPSKPLPNFVRIRDRDCLKILNVKTEKIY